MTFQLFRSIDADEGLKVFLACKAERQLVLGWVSAAPSVAQGPLLKQCLGVDQSCREHDDT